SALNGTLTIVMYLIINFLFGGNFQIKTLFGNLYFMSSTVIIAASINHVKYVLIQKDFANRMSLKQARDALWSEMEVAKRIQTALVPPNTTVGHYEIAAVMIPAAEVGGDYYDIIPTTADPWVMIGDVSGHGVESGLIMMMTQTSVRTILARTPQVEPSKLLIHLNKVIKENISKLNVDRYLTITAINLKENEITYAGSHQDLLVYRKAEHRIESVPSYGTWVGMLDDVDEYMKDRTLPIYQGDMVLLFTDGVTEIGFEQKNMYGQERLEKCFLENINLPLKEIIDKIIQDALNFCPNQEDDITIVIVRRI
ncbi:MAG: SpoIIE family protein phosphatase, partial [Leptospiraceae bacterium]|nr:SpoIIE family protein phosphatase [Leptospiraceae bacterium]